MEQTIQTWQLFGAAIGAALASFLGTWATLIRPMKRQIEMPSERLSLFEAEQKRQNERIKKVEERSEKALTKEEFAERIKKVEERSEKALTKEEFAAYATTTTQSISKMTEKVGILTGVIQGGRK